MLDPLFYPYFGGTEKVVYEVGKRLVKNHGYDITVLTSMIPQAKGVKHENIEGMEVIRTPSIYLDKLPSFMPPPFTVAPFFPIDLLKQDADVFHIHNRFWYYLGTLAIIKLLKRKKLMLTIHNARPRGISPTTDSTGGLYDDTLGRVIFSACNRINCVSRATMEATIPNSMHNKCAVIYNGVDTKAFSPDKGGGSVRKKFGIPDSAPLVLANGRLVTQKGFEYLLEAFAKVKTEVRDAKLLIIGRGPLKEQLEQQAKKLGISDSFFITTGIPEPDLPKYYNAADLFVLPSLYEPSAVVLYEALSCGKPIVATNIGGNPEIVSNDCGFIIPMRSPKALREKMEMFLSDDSLRKRMGAASRKRAIEKFDWNIIAKEWDRSYRQL